MVAKRRYLFYTDGRIFRLILNIDPKRKADDQEVQKLLEHYFKTEENEVLLLDALGLNQTIKVMIRIGSKDRERFITAFEVFKAGNTPMYTYVCSELFDGSLDMVGPIMFAA